MEHDLKVIARNRSPFPEKFGIPRQSGLVENLQGKIVFEPAYRNPDALRGMEEFSHLWLIWEFSENKREGWSPTVRPPRLGGNVRRGVFATRSPFRPNPLGLSCVKIERIEWESSEGPVIWVSGADLMDGTPIFDLKPYLPYVDCKKDALGGFSEEVRGYCLQVEIPEEIRPCISSGKWQEIGEILAQDPRPSYQKDPERIYGMSFERWEIRFQVKEDRLTVCGVEERA